MSLSFSPMRSLSLFALTVSTLFSSYPVQASQKSQDLFGVYPENTMVFAEGRYDPVKVYDNIKNLPENSRENILNQFQEIIQRAKRSGRSDMLEIFKRDISGRMSVAYRAKKAGVGEVLFQIETRNSNTLERMMKGTEKLFKRSKFASYTIYSRHRKKDYTKETFTDTLYLAQQGNIIRGSFGVSDRGIKEMLYLAQVHPESSLWRLSSQKDVQRAKKSLSPRQEQWLYFRSDQAFKALKEQGLQDTTAQELRTHDILNYAEGVGLAVSFYTEQDTGIMLKTYTQHKPKQLSKYQEKYIQQAIAFENTDISQLPDLTSLPLASVFRNYMNSFPSEYPAPKDEPDLAYAISPLANANLAFLIGKLISIFDDSTISLTVTQTHTKKSANTYFRLNTAEKAVPWINVVDGVSLPLVLLSTMGLGDYVGDVLTPEASFTKRNAHRLQTLLETHHFERGDYPNSIAALQADAQNHDYWKGIKNYLEPELPAIADMSSYLNNPHIHRGQVIFEPGPRNDAGLITYYKIYATDSKGERLKNDDGTLFFLTNL